LTPAEQRRALVLASSYDIAAAIELLGPAQGVPRVLSPHNSYFLWGSELLEHESSDLIVAVGISEAMLRKHFRRVERAGRLRCDVCLGDSQDVVLFVAQDPVLPLSSLFWALRRIR